MHRTLSQACGRFGRPWIGSVIEACNLAQSYSGWRSEDRGGDQPDYNDGNSDSKDSYSRRDQQGRKRFRFASGFQGPELDFKENRINKRGHSKANHAEESNDSDDWAEERFYENRDFRGKIGNPRSQQNRPNTGWDEEEFFRDRDHGGVANRTEMDWDEEEFFKDRDKGSGRSKKNRSEWDEEDFFEGRDYSEKSTAKGRGNRSELSDWDEEGVLEDRDYSEKGNRRKNDARMDWEENFEGKRLHTRRRNENRYSGSELEENSADGEFDVRGRTRWPDHYGEKHWGEDVENDGFDGRTEAQGKDGEKGWGEDFDGTGGRDVETTYSEGGVQDKRALREDDSDFDGEDSEDIDPDEQNQHARDQDDENDSDSNVEPRGSYQDDERNYEEFDDEEDGGGEPHELDRMLADIEDDSLANEEMLHETNPPGMYEFDDDVLESLENVKEAKEYVEEPAPSTKGLDENLRLKTQERKLEALTRALGTFYQPPLGKPYKAQRMNTLKEDLDEKRKKMGHEHPVVIKLLLNLAHQMDDYKKYSSSEPLYRELLETRKKMWGKEHEVVATAMIALGNNAKAQDRTDEGEKLLKDGLKMLIKCNPKIYQTLLGVGDRLLDEKQPEKAESMAEAALIISRAKHPGIHVETADALRHLVQCVLNSNHFQDAEKYAREELEMRKKLDGEESPEVAVSIATLGYCHIGNLNYREADLEIREGLAMRRKLMGRLDSEVGRMTHYLGLTLLGLGLFHEAEDILKDAIGIYERLGYNEHLILPATMMSLSEAYMGQNKIKETHAIRRHAIGLYHKLGVHVTNEL